MKIVVIFDEEKTETVAVKNKKYILYKKMKNFVDKFDDLFDEYIEKISPEIVENAADPRENIEEFDEVMDEDLKITDMFYELKNKINDICFETVERA